MAMRFDAARQNVFAGGVDFPFGLAEIASNGSDPAVPDRDVCLEGFE